MKKSTLLTFVPFVFLDASTLPLIKYDPFYKSQAILRTSTDIKVQKESLVLDAIFNNKAFINGKFYAAGDKIGEYTIKKVTKESVVLQNKKRIKILRLKQKQHQLIIKQQKRAKR